MAEGPLLTLSDQPSATAVDVNDGTTAWNKHNGAV
jgi:hypothetical protein